MKTYYVIIRLAVCCAVGLTHSASYAQERLGRVLTEEQLTEIVNPTLEQCSPKNMLEKSGRVNPDAVIPTRNARELPKNRIAKTLHGMWRGRVLGDDNDVGVDYFWIFDIKNNEALIIAQRTGKQTMAELQLQPVANAPKFSYLICAHEGYFPSKDKPQLQEFVKVSNDIKDAERVFRMATGLKQLQRGETKLSAIWRALLKQKYFSKLDAVAFAGGFFKPIQIGRVPSVVGPAQVSLKWDSEYYGGGSTAIKFKKEVPIKGVEYGQFVGTSTGSGDFLVSSPGNGNLWKVEAMSGANYDIGFDAVVLGPMQ